jgi:hypothetical protein
VLTPNAGGSIWRLTRGPVVALVMVLVPAASGRTASSGIAKDKIAGGEHWRVRTSRGPVHVWCPAFYDRGTAGTVVYVHGYAVDADEAWERHELARQFQASRRNAVFLVPEAPASSEDTVRFPSLNELLSAAGAGIHRTLPQGPVVVVGHSGAHRTLVPWLKNPRVSHVILLDAVYGSETVTAVRDWLRTSRGRLIVVAADTAEESERLIQGLPSAVRRGAIPESASAFTARERLARVDYLRSQYGHLEIVTEGKAIAPLLGLTRLPRIAPRPSAPARPRK